jgi:chromosome segregation ATPase
MDYIYFDQILEWEKRMKAQQGMYESVRNERNSYSKTLVESQDELAEVRRKFKIMEHQTEQLKEEIGAKDAALVKESFEHQKVEKRNEQQEQRISRADKLLKANDDVIHKQDAEIQRLASMIRRTDEEALTQRKEYDQVINERDILGTQLIRRNDELALLYEKLNIMAATLRTGEGQYNARLNDIRLLRIKVRDLQRELALANSSNHGVEDIRRELFTTTRELLSEKIKVKALSGELENPLNVHRWRKLEGSDPATYEMVQKVQTLQKRLIAKTEEVVERDQLLVEKDKLYNEVKTMLARQPGPEVAEQLTVYQANLRKKSRQLKSMASELNMYQSQADEFKHEVERLSRELQDTKRKFYESKKRDQIMYEQSREMEYGNEDEFLNSGSKRSSNLGRSQAQQQLALAHSATTRYAGGGFAIK